MSQFRYRIQVLSQLEVSAYSVNCFSWEKKYIFHLELRRHQSKTFIWTPCIKSDAEYIKGVDDNGIEY